MRSGDAQRDYLVATELHKEGRYEEALRLLDELQQDRPDSKHVLYYRGLCLVALGRLTEATAVCDRLSSHHSESGRRLTAKLSARIADRVQSENSHIRPADAVHPPAPSIHSSDEGHPEVRGVPSTRHASASEDFATESPSAVWKGYLFAGILLVSLIVAIAAFVVHRNQVREGMEPPPLPIPEGSVPDKFLDVVSFYPAERDRPYEFVVFLTPWDGSMPSSEMGTADDCVGNALVAEWPQMERDAGRALHAIGGAEPLGGTPRDRMVKTLVLPGTAQGFTGPVQGRQVKTFVPGRVTDLAAVVASCGKPTRVESWEANGRCVGIAGKVQWWGRVGVAVDNGAAGETGTITHVLLREYPLPEPKP